MAAVLLLQTPRVLERAASLWLLFEALEARLPVLRPKRVDLCPAAAKLP